MNIRARSMAASSVSLGLVSCLMLARGPFVTLIASTKGY